MKFQIQNTVSGADLGIYEGATREEALDAMVRDAGYANHAAACAATGEDGSDLRVTEIPGLTIELERQEGEPGRVAVKAWRGPRAGQADINGFYQPGSGDTSAICGATEIEADEIATAGDAWGRGGRDGVAEVEDVLREHGADVVIATLRPGHVAWDEAARGACTHRLAGISEEHAEAYYEAYELSARARAEQIRDEQEAP